MELYKIVNKARCGLIIATYSQARAIEIAIIMNHIRKPENGKIKNITEKLKKEPGIKEILEGTKEGFVGLSINNDYSRYVLATPPKIKNKKYCHDPKHEIPCQLPCQACEEECNNGI